MRYILTVDIPDADLIDAQTFHLAHRAEGDAPDLLTEVTEALSARLTEFYPFDQAARVRMIGGTIATPGGLRALLAAAEVGLDGADAETLSPLGLTVADADQAQALVERLRGPRAAVSA